MTTSSVMLIKKLLRRSSRAACVSRDGRGQGHTATMTEVKQTSHYSERQIVSISKKDADAFGFNIRTYENNTTASETLTCVCSVKEDSPAQSAGLKTGDVIVSVNSICVEDFDHEQIVDLCRRNSCLLKMEIVRGTSVKQKELQKKLEQLQGQLREKGAELQMLITQEERLRRVFQQGVLKERGSQRAGVSSVSSKPHTSAGVRTDLDSDSPVQETMADSQAAPASKSTEQKPDEEAAPKDAAAPDQEANAQSGKEPPKPEEQKKAGQEEVAAGADDEKKVSEDAGEEKKEGEEGAEKTKEEKADGGAAEEQSEEKASQDEEGGEEEKTQANKYFTVNYRKIKKGYAKQRISAFETLDFAPLEEEGASEEQKDGATSEQKDGATSEQKDGATAEQKDGATAEQKDGATAEQKDGTTAEQDGAIAEQKDGATAEEGSAAKDQSNGEKSQNGQKDEKTEGTEKEQNGEKAVGEAGDEQDEEKNGGEEEDGGEEACDGTDGKQNQSGISKYFTVSYRKIKKGLTKQRVDEYEFMGVQQE